MKIDFVNSQLMLKLTKYFGEMEDGREFAIVARSNDSSIWIEDIEIDDDFAEAELDEIRNRFNEEVSLL